jgi:Ca-activated chloride channel family protein
MRIRLARRSRTSLGVLSVLAALGAVIVLRSPTAADAPTPSMPAPTPSVATGARVELDGPAIDGVLAFGESALLASGSSDVYAELRLTGLAPESAAPRAPAALAVVIDHSGSMSGPKMQQADEAVVSLLSRMRDDDWLSVTVYDDSAEILQPLARVDTLRESLPALVRRVQANGGTNIPLGLDLGATTLASAPAGSIRRIVLLSDGIDGSGEPLASIEARIATRASDRTTTSALGIGIDYDERVMSGIAEAGHGNYAFLEREEMLAPFLGRELDQASSTVADSVVAELDLPTGLSLVEAHGASIERAGSSVRIPIGAIWAGERRKVVLHLSAAPGAAGTAVEAPVRLSYRTIDSEPHAIAGVATLARVATDAELTASRDADIWGDAYATVLDSRQDLALAAWREGRRDDALQLTQANVAALRQAQAVAPSAGPVFAQRIAERQQEMQDYQAEASSSAGRSSGLAHRAARIQAAAAF